jgi:hypothetical protein
MIEAKAFRTFIRVYSLLKNEHLSANIKLTLHEALIWSVMTYACPAWDFAARYPSNEIAAPVEQGSPHHQQFSKAHAGPRIT